MPTQSSQQKETNMDNLATFKNEQDTSTGLVVVDQMSAKDALALHTTVKSQGRGSVSSFVKNDTSYDSYPKYYYELKKKGVVPFNPRGPRNEVITENPLELRIQQLEMQLLAPQVTPAKRAVEVLYKGVDTLSYPSRKFLCSVVQRNSATLSPKQESWLGNLEQDFA